MKHKSLNQLLCAATVNVRFREVLLNDPAKAIASGYFDHSFALTQEEQDMVVGIQAQRLEDFAAQVYHWISDGSNGFNGNGRNGKRYHGNGHNGKGHNGNGHKHETSPSDSLVDVYRTPVLAHA
ncbi:MAG: hypothetical protein PVG56_13480 [Anaerolineae bacterium]|jgi:hypothetical protein